MYMRRDGDGGMAIDHSRDSESRFGEICAILSIFGSLSTFVVALRSYTRLILLRNFGLDDGVMVAAQVLTVGSAVAIGLESKYGLGEHTWVQPQEHFVPYMKSFYSSIIVYNISMCLVKVSILLQYRRIFAVRTMQVATLGGIIFLILWTTTLFFLLTLVCVPVAKFWDDTISGRCLDRLVIWYTMAGFNVATDLIIFGLPLPVIRSLQLPLRQKIMLCAVFSLGLFTCAISIVRIRTLKMAAETSDPNWDNVDAATWSFIEVTIAVLAASLPTLRPLLSRFMPRVFGSSAGNSAGQTQHGPYMQTSDSKSYTGTKTVGRTTATVVAGSDASGSFQDLDSIELASHTPKVPPSHDPLR